MSCEDRPTADTDPGECRWCLEWATGGEECPYHGERAQVEGDKDLPHNEGR